MTVPASSTAAETLLPVVSDVEQELSRLVDENLPKQPPSQTDAERIRLSILRLTSTSIEGLEGLSSELQELQNFLNSEVRRVHGEIETALAGIKIIMETIAPWKMRPAPVATPANSRPVRAGPAAALRAANGSG
jgi:hypothetical protein